VRAEIEGSEGDWWVWVGGWVTRQEGLESTPRLMDGSIEELDWMLVSPNGMLLLRIRLRRYFQLSHHCLSLFSKIMQENPGNLFRGSEAVFGNVADFHFPCLDVATFHRV